MHNDEMHGGEKKIKINLEVDKIRCCNGCYALPHVR